MATELFVYGDESGIEQSPYCVVAGWIATPKHWDSFNLAWRKIIEDAEVKEFHSKLFFGRHAATKGGTKNPFRDWPKDKANNFLAALIQVVHDHYPRITPVGCVLDVEAFMSFSWGERRFITGASWDNEEKRFIGEGAPTRVYPLPFHSMVGEALQLAKPADCKVHFVMDEQKVLLHGVQRIYAKTRDLESIPEELRRKMGDLTSALSHEKEGIQAADLLAYCWHGWYQRPQLRGERVRALFTLLDKHRREMGVARRAGIQRVLNNALKAEDREILKAMTGPIQRKRNNPL